MKARSGMLLAGMEGIKYRKNELQLTPGDKLYLYTDGVTEATDNNTELYGEQRLLDFVNSLEKTEPESLCKLIKEDVDKFVGTAPQFDDITMLALNFDAILGDESISVVPDSDSRTAVGAFAEAAEKILKQKEDIISQLDASLGTTVLNDCLEEKKRTLEKHKQRFSEQLTQVVLRVVTPITVVFVSLFFSINYMLSKDEIEQYNLTMLQAQNYITERAYINAIAAYDKAQAEYNGSFNTDGYKNDAIIKKEEACKLLFEQTNKLSKEYFSKGEYLNSRRELDNIKVYMLSPTLLTDYNREYNNLIKQIESAIEKDKNTLILNIAANNGKLNATGKKLLKQLLEICPEDYWLNIIQQKQK